MHVQTSICQDSGQLASPYCYNVISGSVVLIHNDSMYADIDPILVKQYIPNAVYTGVTSEEYAMTMEGGSMGATCSLHTPSWYNYGGGNEDLQNAKQEAQRLIREIGNYLNNVQNISDTDRNTLIQGMQDLEDYVNASLTEYIKRATEQLRLNFNAIYEENPPVGAGW